MKFPVFFQVIRKLLIMKVLIIMFGLNPFNITHSNPIIPPPSINELYFSPSCVFIEFCMLDDYEGNLDNYRIAGLYDTAQFETGIEFTAGVPFHVSSYDFNPTIYINPEGDILYLEHFYNGNWEPVDYEPFAFGNIPGYCTDVTAPVGEESISFQELSYCGEPIYYRMAKELPQSIGGPPYKVVTRGMFSGDVKDRNGELMPWIIVDYLGCYDYGCSPMEPLIYTGSDGFFSSSNMFCANYRILFRIDNLDGPIISETYISIEPDSANYFEFQLDTLLTGIEDIKASKIQNSIFTIPNPSSSQTTFIIETNHVIPGTKGIIKIYNEAGYIVDIVPVELDNDQVEMPYNFAGHSLSSGLYIYNLEIRNQKVASGKMIVYQ